MRIVIADFNEWDDEMRKGNSHILRQFLKRGNEGCWIYRPIHIGRFIRYESSLVRRWLRGVHKGSEGVWSLTPFALVPHINVPVLGGSWVGMNSLRWTIPSTQRALKHIGFEEPDILWIGNTRLASAIKCVRPRNIVFRISDLWAAEPLSYTGTAAIEVEVCRRSTVVFGVSQAIVSRARNWTEKVVYLPNGVNLDRFDQSFMKEPEDLAKIPRPRVIYVGAVAYHVELTLIEKIARERPDIHIVIVGPVSDLDAMKPIDWSPERYSRIPNLHFLGPRPFDSIPSYMKHSDVGIMPFTDVERNHAASPNKLNEFSAAGLPVVSRALDECQYYCQDVLYYRTLDECIQLLDVAIANRESLGNRMRSFAERNTWDVRYATVVDSLLKYGDIDIG